MSKMTSCAVGSYFLIYGIVEVLVESFVVVGIDIGIQKTFFELKGIEPFFELKGEIWNLKKSVSKKFFGEMSKRTRPSTVIPDDPFDTGTRIKIYWPLESKYFKGTIASRAANGKYRVEYDDKDVRYHDLRFEDFVILDFTCICGMRYSSQGWLDRHQARCASYIKSTKSTIPLIVSSMSKEIDNDKILSVLKTGLKCSICMDTAVVPTLPDCGHIFCKECISKHIRMQGQNASCPNCRSFLPNMRHTKEVPLLTELSSML